MAELRNPIAVNDTLTVPIPRRASGYVAAQIALGTAVGLSVVLEFSASDQAKWSTPVKMVDPVAGESGALIAALTTDGQSGWARCPAYTHARLRVAALTSGAPGSWFLEFREQ